MAEGIIDAGLAQKIAELRRADALERERSLGAAEGGLGPAPVAIEPAPRGAYPIIEGGVAGEPVSLTATPRGASYGMRPGDLGRRRDADTWRGLGATIAGAAPLIPAISATVAPLGAWPLSAELGLGAYAGSVAGAGATLPSFFGGESLYGRIGEGADEAASAMYRSPDTAGTFTPGARVRSELGGGELPSRTPAEIDYASERVESMRAEQRAQEQILIAQRQREMEEHQRRLAEARAREAAKQMALEQMFGSQEERAGDIISLEALSRAR